MRLRLSNEVDWAAEFAAHDQGQLEAGCRWAWRQFVSERGVDKTTLYLHYWDGREFMSSGQYTLSDEVKIKLPPTPHPVSRVPGKNNWSLLWLCLVRCLDHARAFQGLVEFVSEPSDNSSARNDRKKQFRIVRGGKNGR